MTNRTIRVIDHETSDGIELIFFEIGSTVHILRPGGMATTTFVDCIRFLIDPAFQQTNPTLLESGNFLTDLLPYLDTMSAKIATIWTGNDTTGEGYLANLRDKLEEQRPEVFQFIGSPRMVVGKAHV